MKKEFKAIRDVKFPAFGIDVKAGEFFKLDDKQFSEVAHFGYGKWFDFADKTEEVKVNKTIPVTVSQLKEEKTEEIKEMVQEVSDGMVKSVSEPKTDDKIIEEMKTEDLKEKKLKLKAKPKKKAKKK